MRPSGVTVPMTGLQIGKVCLVSSVQHRRQQARRPLRRTVCAYREPGQTYDITAVARQKLRPGAASSPAAGSDSSAAAPINDFVRKLKAAWRIFFPAQPASTSPKEEGKNRLRMILVADRCGMNPSSLFDMKHSIVRAVADYVDIEAEELVEVNVTTDPDMGTIYSVAVPIKRVKPTARVPMGGDVEDVDGITLRWDPDDPESDPSSEFPFGC